MNKNMITVKNPQLPPFLLPVEKVYSSVTGDAIISGTIMKGEVHTGDTMEIVGSLAPSSGQSVVCSAIEINRKIEDNARAGDKVSILLSKEFSLEDITVGQVLAAPGKFGAYNLFVAECSFGSLENEITADSHMAFHIYNADIAGSVELPKDMRAITSGSTAELAVQLIYHLALFPDLPFSIRQNGKNIGNGIITKVLR